MYCIPKSQYTKSVVLSKVLCCVQVCVVFVFVYCDVGIVSCVMVREAQNTPRSSSLCGYYDIYIHVDICVLSLVLWSERRKTRRAAQVDVGIMTIPICLRGSRPQPPTSRSDLQEISV